MMGETVAATVCGQQTEYGPGNWFNSAKFFDIEYQTYGRVLPELSENESTLFWDGKDGRRCLRIVYESDTGSILGINTLGIRLRHETCDKWLKNRINAVDVLKGLEMANFDPEFFKKFEKEVQNYFSDIRS